MQVLSGPERYTAQWQAAEAGQFGEYLARDTIARNNPTKFAFSAFIAFNRRIKRLGRSKANCTLLPSENWTDFCSSSAMGPVCRTNTPRQAGWHVLPFFPMLILNYFCGVNDTTYHNYTSRWDIGTIFRRCFYHARCWVHNQ